MVPLRRWAAHAGLVGIIATMFLGNACDMFDFERGVPVACVHKSDCSDGLACISNACRRPCSTSSDCAAPWPSCVDSVCSTASTVGIGDASACACGLACANGACSEGQNGCLFAWYTPLGEGIPGPETTPWALSENELWGQQIYVRSSGRLIGLGMYVTIVVNAAPSPYFLALYKDDGGGYPGERLWAPASPATIDATSEKQEIEVPCTGPDVSVTEGYYWIVGVWASPPIALDVSAGPVLWATALLPSFAPPPSPFPNAASDPTLLPAARPAVDFYAVVAE
jgi:hypothetical protein